MSVNSCWVASAYDTVSVVAVETGCDGVSEASESVACSEGFHSVHCGVRGDGGGGGLNIIVPPGFGHAWSWCWSRATLARTFFNQMLCGAASVAGHGLTRVFEKNLKTLGHDFTREIPLQCNKFRHADATLDVGKTFVVKQMAKSFGLQLSILFEELNQILVRVFNGDEQTRESCALPKVSEVSQCLRGQNRLSPDV